VALKRQEAEGKALEENVFFAWRGGIFNQNASGGTKFVFHLFIFLGDID